MRTQSIITSGLGMHWIGVRCGPWGLRRRIHGYEHIRQGKGQRIENEHPGNRAWKKRRCNAETEGAVNHRGPAGYPWLPYQLLLFSTRRIPNRLMVKVSSSCFALWADCLGTDETR